MPISSGPSSDAEIIEFLVLCLENSGKTDFEQVAKHSKITRNASAAYKKLWEMKRKFRAQQADGASSVPFATPKSPTRVMKPRSSKAKKGIYKEVAPEKGDGDQ